MSPLTSQYTYLTGFGLSAAVTIQSQLFRRYCKDQGDVPLKTICPFLCVSVPLTYSRSTYHAITIGRFSVVDDNPRFNAYGSLDLPPSLPPFLAIRNNPAVSIPAITRIRNIQPLATTNRLGAAVALIVERLSTLPSVSPSVLLPYELNSSGDRVALRPSLYSDRFQREFYRHRRFEPLASHTPD